MNIRVLKNNGEIKFCESKCWVGDIVNISSLGHHYPTYTDAFLYFWGTNKNDDKHSDVNSKTQLWKVINIAMHGSLHSLIYHIRNLHGENLVIGQCGIKVVSQNKNNPPSSLPTIYQINNTKHSWKEKLYKLD